VLDEMQAHYDLWVLRMRVVECHPTLLPRLVSGGAQNERAIAAALAARLGLPADHDHPALVAAVAGAALRVCMGQWVRSGGNRPLTDLVDEAFAALAAGLPPPPAGT
jgi:hypothetical protein